MDEMDLGTDVNEPIESEELTTEVVPEQSDIEKASNSGSDLGDELPEDDALGEAGDVEESYVEEEGLSEDTEAPEVVPDIEPEELMEDERPDEDVELADYAEKTESEELPEDVEGFGQAEVEKEVGNSEIPEDIEAEGNASSETGDLAEDREQEAGLDAGDPHESFGSLSEYMNAHNYGRDDFDTYSKDPEWQRLHKEEFPDWEPPVTWASGSETDDWTGETGGVEEEELPEDIGDSKPDTSTERDESVGDGIPDDNNELAENVGEPGRGELEEDAEDLGPMEDTEAEVVDLSETSESTEDRSNDVGRADPERAPELMDAQAPEQKGETAPPVPGDYEAWKTLEEVPFAGETQDTNNRIDTPAIPEYDAAGVPNSAQQMSPAEYDRSAIYAKNNFAFDAAQANVSQANREFENLRRWQPGPTNWDEGVESSHSVDLSTLSEASDASVPPDWERIEDTHDLESDLKELNTEYNPELDNEWSNNCQRCAPAFEMRRRGYDISAKPSIEYAYDDLKYRPEAVWESPDVQLTTGNGKADIEAAMSSWGDGARAEIVTYWKDGGGHAFSAEQVDGVTRFVDAQSGSEDVDWYFDLNKTDGSTRFWRTDTAVPSSRISDCCMRRSND